MDSLIEALKSISNEVEEDLVKNLKLTKAEQQQVTKAGALVYKKKLEEALMRAHGRSGKQSKIADKPLVDSIIITNTSGNRNDSQSTFLTAEDGNVNKLFWLEFGTKRGIQPYNTLSFVDESIKSEITKAMEDELDKIMDRK